MLSHERSMPPGNNTPHNPIDTIFRVVAADTEADTSELIRKAKHMVLNNSTYEERVAALSFASGMWADLSLMYTTPARNALHDMSEDVIGKLIRYRADSLDFRVLCSHLVNPHATLQFLAGDHARYASGLVDTLTARIQQMPESHDHKKNTLKYTLLDTISEALVRAYAQTTPRQWGLALAHHERIIDPFVRLKTALLFPPEVYESSDLIRDAALHVDRITDAETARNAVESLRMYMRHAWMWRHAKGPWKNHEISFSVPYFQQLNHILFQSDTPSATRYSQETDIVLRSPVQRMEQRGALSHDDIVTYFSLCYDLYMTTGIDRFRQAAIQLSYHASNIVDLDEYVYIQRNIWEMTEQRSDLERTMLFAVAVQGRATFSVLEALLLPFAQGGDSRKLEGTIIDMDRRADTLDIHYEDLVPLYTRARIICIEALGAQPWNTNPYDALAMTSELVGDYRSSYKNLPSLAFVRSSSGKHPLPINRWMGLL